MNVQASLSGRGGFILVVVVILLSFLLIVTVGLAAFARVGARVSDQEQKRAQARENALLALNLALGQLQKYAGPDQRATARTELTSNPVQPYLTGAWNTAVSPPELLTWLVSGNEANPFAVTPATAPSSGFTATSTQVVLVGPKTVSSPAHAVVLEKQPIVSTHPGVNGRVTVGHYAYWVSDEGVKISTSATDTLRAAIGAAPAANPCRVRLQVFYAGVDPEITATAASLEKISVFSQLAFAGPSLSSLKATFHQVTPCAYAVESDPIHGGLKIDQSSNGVQPDLNPYCEAGESRCDEIFFSGDIPPGTDPDGLPSAKFHVVRRGGTLPPVAELQSPASAEHLLCAGSFNLNSPSPQAWQAILENARTKRWSASAALANGAAGSRTLNDAELAALATEIASRLRQACAPDKRAGEPFASVDALARSGLMQAALDATSINVGRTRGTDPDYVSGEDVLAILAPLLTARSDTFVIRAYGDVENPATSVAGVASDIVARAWCEAVVQRLPEFVDATQNASTPRTAWNETNSTFGRRFVIVGFRWLSPDDL